jgi:hypothetical protein
MVERSPAWGVASLNPSQLGVVAFDSSMPGLTVASVAGSEGLGGSGGLAGWVGCSGGGVGGGGVARAGGRTSNASVATRSRRASVEGVKKSACDKATTTPAWSARLSVKLAMASVWDES